MRPTSWREWLQQVWADEAIVEAVELASPHLVRRVDAVCAGHVVRPRRVRRAVGAVVRYLLRMHSRATPFGLFVGGAPMRIGAHAGVRTQEPGSAAARPDSAWRAGLFPLSADGMIVAASMSLLSDARQGRRGGALPWPLLIVGSAASLAANVAVAGQQPDRNHPEPRAVQ
ncbi:lantibiotic dehydratase [Streptomonospora salina]|uniref:Lantibiotic dehydratase N-terminal domain-containing protein n=1 Tax=Streptomonospora salina TaxID=104205 RepID=A0A841E727_9ACTN|nr:lantibiotic dehydratase [Streptomonospora salina]MBB5996958.1 hypothetical protein [Streptomonospora salina]